MILQTCFELPKIGSNLSRLPVRTRVRKSQAYTYLGLYLISIKVSAIGGCNARQVSKSRLRKVVADHGCFAGAPQYLQIKDPRVSASRTTAQQSIACARPHGPRHCKCMLKRRQVPPSFSCSESRQGEAGKPRSYAMMSSWQSNIALVLMFSIQGPYPRDVAWLRLSTAAGRAPFHRTDDECLRRPDYDRLPTCMMRQVARATDSLSRMICLARLRARKAAAYGGPAAACAF